MEKKVNHNRLLNTKKNWQLMEALQTTLRSGNETKPTDFILLGFFPEFKYISAMVSIILLIYMATFTGNTLLILLIWLYSHLHTPMYFLLSQLSLMDLTLTSSIIPKMATNFFSGWRSISFLACGTQIFFSLTVAIAECILITLMCFDRYVAICDPLRYPAIINLRVCLQMIAMSWVGGALTSLGHTAFTLHFNICSPREIPHFFCEVMAVLRIVCEDISAYEKAVVITSILVLLLPLSLILSSYVLIFLAVLRMNSPEGRNKALATCSSHLCVVGLYFGPGLCIYMRPGSAKTPKLNQGLFLFGTVLTPLLNPLAYSLRNKEVLSALKKLMGRCQSSSIYPAPADMQLPRVEGRGMVKAGPTSTMSPRAPIAEDPPWWYGGEAGNWPSSSLFSMVLVHSAQDVLTVPRAQTGGTSHSTDSPDPPLG
ncbi:olfactory receptor 2M5-like [Herpailurus yagouaroundi]|uniref:olfactory receptor 2M5-like n=1 Tax=Herpailurus yagouaroundi TaxID=1608482 RepID=UPI001AD74B97|nr:olfactory receptor 2M5-like [Puma yagouaroundi]